MVVDNEHRLDRLLSQGYPGVSLLSRHRRHIEFEFQIDLGIAGANGKGVVSVSLRIKLILCRFIDRCIARKWLIRQWRNIEFNFWQVVIAGGFRRHRDCVPLAGATRRLRHQCLLSLLKLNAQERFGGHAQELIDIGFSNSGCIWITVRVQTGGHRVRLATRCFCRAGLRCRNVFRAFGAGNRRFWLTTRDRLIVAEKQIDASSK